MYGRGYYGSPYAPTYAHPYAHNPYAYLGADPSAPPPAGLPMVVPAEHAMPTQEVEHRVKVKPAAVHLSTGGFFQVALAVTLGLVGAGVIAGAAGAAAYKYRQRERHVGNGNGNGNGNNGGY
jgi:hypothetical protein